MSPFANCRSQFLLDRLGRCLKLTVSSESISCHEFASQFGLECFSTRKNPETIVARMLFTSIRYAASNTTKLEAAEPSQLAGVAVRRMPIDYDVGGCGVQVYEFKRHAGNNGFFFHFYCLRLTRLTLKNPRNIISNIIIIFNINSTRGQTRFLTCVARVTCLVRLKVAFLYNRSLYLNVSICHLNCYHTIIHIAINFLRHQSFT